MIQKKDSELSKIDEIVAERLRIKMIEVEKEVNIIKGHCRKQIENTET